jgi:hypothetical protein
MLCPGIASALMDLGPVVHPRGPLPPGVYWRRRAVTAGLLVLLAALLLRSCGGEGGTDTLRSGASPTPTPSTTPGATATSAPTRSAAPAPTRSPGGICRTADLRVTAASNATSYSGGTRPVLRITVTNVGPVACVREIGQGARELRVVSGTDRVWSSDDCAPGGPLEPTLLQPGETKTSTVAWAKRRSAPGCPTGRPDAAPGTYRVVGRLGDITVEGNAFTLR